MKQSKRLLELDALRGLAAISVVLFHYTHRFDKLYDHSPELLIHFRYGEYGVELFFLISGFVIFLSLERTKRGLDFLIRRFARLYPAYWTAVILTYTIVSLADLPDREIRWQDALLNLTLLQRVLGVPRVDGVYWTLELELSFYIIMFILFQARLLKHINKISVVWLLLMVSIFVLEEPLDLDISRVIEVFFILEYANLFIVGMMIYKIHQEGFSAKRYAIILGCVLTYWVGRDWIDVLILIFLILLLHLSLRGNLAFINQKPILFLGSISYSLYLIHQNIGYVVMETLQGLDINSHVSVAIAIGVAILLASLITFRIEQPIMDLIKRQ